MSRSLRSILLAGAVLLPLLYFGVQLALAPGFPHYNPMTDAASLLGSDRAPHGGIFNAVALACGVCGGCGAVGLFDGLRAERCPRALNVLIGLAVLVTAAGCIWAGLFPLPDPRHGRNPTAPALVALPLLFAIAGCVVPALRRLRGYFVINLLAMIVLALLMSGVIAIDRARYGGLLQRLVAAAALLPVGVAGAALWRRAR